MGLHTDLNIHAAAVNLLDAVTESTLHMRRDAKPHIGRMLLVEALDITTLIQRANMDRDKAQHLDALLEKKSRVEVLLLVSLNRKLISPGLYGLATRWSTSIGKQAIGWRRDSARRQLHDRQGGHASA